VSTDFFKASDDHTGSGGAFGLGKDLGEVVLTAGGVKRFRIFELIFFDQNKLGRVGHGLLHIKKRHAGQ
jgi:hypothetical protein